MKIGLLVCDQVRPEYQAAFGDYPAMFADLFPDAEWELFNVYKGEFPEDALVCDVYMATGSSHSVYEDVEWIHETKAFLWEINAAKKYFIGFCFGHQLLAEAFGGKVAKAPVGWCVGIHTFDIFTLKHWMRPGKTQVNFLMMCQDQVVILPPNAERLAGSADCPNAIMQIGDTMVSIQGHPEFSKEYDKILMQIRVERIGAEKVKKGVASLRQEIDVPVFKLWMDNFLKKVRAL